MAYQPWARPPASPRPRRPARPPSRGTRRCPACRSSSSGAPARGSSPRRRRRRRSRRCAPCGSRSPACRRAPNSQPNRPPQKRCARSTSVDGNSMWTISPAMGFLSFGIGPDDTCVRTGAVAEGGSLVRSHSSPRAVAVTRPVGDEAGTRPIGCLGDPSSVGSSRCRKLQQRVRTGLPRALRLRRWRRRRQDVGGRSTTSAGGDKTSTGGDTTSTSGDKTFEGDDYSFTYPADWDEQDSCNAQRRHAPIRVRRSKQHRRMGR